MRSLLDDLLGETCAEYSPIIITEKDMGPAKLLEHGVAMFRTMSAFRAPRTKHIRSTKASRPSQTSLTIHSGDSSSYNLTFFRQLLEMPFTDLQPPSRKAMTEIPIQKDEEVETLQTLLPSHHATSTWSGPKLG